MWTTWDSQHSIRTAAAYLEGRDPSEQRCRQIAGVIAFARRMVSLAPRVQVHIRYRWPSAVAANDEQGRWVELLALDGEFRLEFWETRSDLERPPSPERAQAFAEADAAGWQNWSVYNAESWVCRVEKWRWLPAHGEPGAPRDPAGG